MTSPDIPDVSSELQVQALHRKWILEGWEKKPGETFDFKEKLGALYDWESDATLLHDTADAQLRLARSPQEWADAFERNFGRMRSALHAVTDGPYVLASGDMASSHLQFCARLESADGSLSGVLCRNSMVWLKRAGVWRIVREHTSGKAISIEETEALLRKFEPQKLPAASE